MSKTYLQRVITALLTDSVLLGDEIRMREQIADNAREFADPSRVKKSLHLASMRRADRLLAEGILTSLLNEPDAFGTEEELFRMVAEYEKGILVEAHDQQVFKFTDAHNLEIYRVVLELALADNEISQDEFALLNELR